MVPFKVVGQASFQSPYMGCYCPNCR
jgi:hypothetical protein